MKVVLFCGGMGTRMRDYSEAVPKPMVRLRYRPILWHIMRYYAHYGVKEFILALGYKGDVIKDYFLNYNECLSNDFVMTDGGRRVDLLRRDIDDWRITFVDTGLTSNIGERLRAVEPYVGGDELFLANYADGLTDCPLPRLLDHHLDTKSIATFLAVKPSASFHLADLDETGAVRGVRDVKSTATWINGGFFVLRNEIFDYLGPGEELVLEPFQRLIRLGALSALRHEGFWRGVDTFKDLMEMEHLVSQDAAPWEVWRKLDEALPAETIRLQGQRVGGAAA